MEESSATTRKLRLGSRKSQLALIQTNIVLNQLKELYPEVEFEIVTMSTTGDKILDKALSKIGEKSLFTKELEIALENREVDLVVHSLKDLPTTLPRGMAIGAISRREDPTDAVVLHERFKNLCLKTLPTGSIIGTSSLRRIAQLQYAHPHLKFENIRGNLNTRFRKLDEDERYAGLILATSGIQRMDWSHRINQKLQYEECLHAVGQGALAVEIRADDVLTSKLLGPINHKETLLRCVAERAFMKTLEGGCSVPIGVHSLITDGKVHLMGGVFSLDGSKRVIESYTLEDGPRNHFQNETEAVPGKNSSCGVQVESIPAIEIEKAEETGINLAKIMLQKGAEEILNEVRK